MCPGFESLHRYHFHIDLVLQLEILSQLKDFIEKNSIKFDIGVAFSGGRDSIVLAQALKKIYSTGKIFLLYVNHHLREDSQEEENFVTKWAKNNKFQIEIFHINEKIERNIEEKARKLRYEFFDSWSESKNAVVFTAHHLDDQVETLLYRIFKGTGINGLIGIKMKRGNIFRPLLNVDGNMISQYAKKNDLSWYEDPSNQNNRFSRNAIRNRILPDIKEFFGTDVTRNIIKLPDLFSEYYSNRSVILKYLLEKGMIKYNAGQIVVEKELFSMYFPSFIKYLVESSVRRVFSIDLIFNKSKWQEISKAILKDNTKLLLKENIILFTTKDKIWIQSSENVQPAEIDLKSDPEGSFLWNDWGVSWKISEKVNQKDFSPFTIQVDLQKAGDSFLIAGAQKGLKIKKANNNFLNEIRKIYADNKVPLPDRTRIPVVYTRKNSDPVGGPYIGVSDKFKVTSETEKIFRIHFHLGDG